MIAAEPPSSQQQGMETVPEPSRMATSPQPQQGKERSQSEIMNHVEQSQSAPVNGQNPPPPEGLTAPTVNITRAELDAIVKQANGGDAEALAQLRRILDENPLLWQQLGDLGAHAETLWIQLITGGNQLTIESVKRQLAQMRLELAGTDPQPEEKHLVDYAIACWLRVQHAELAEAQSDGGAVPLLTFRLRRLELAHKTYREALKMLATLRGRVQPALKPTPRQDSARPEEQAERNGRHMANGAQSNGAAAAETAQVAHVNGVHTNGHAINRLRVFTERGDLQPA